MGDVVLRHLAAATPVARGDARRRPRGVECGYRRVARRRADGPAGARRPRAPRLHRPRPPGPGLRDGLADRADLVVCMDRGHRQTLASMARARAGDYRHERGWCCCGVRPAGRWGRRRPRPVLRRRRRLRALPRPGGGRLPGPRRPAGGRRPGRSGPDRARSGGAPTRIAVHGASGSGKTTLATALAARLGLARTELDALFHQPGWTELPTDEFRAEVASRVAGRPLGGRRQLPGRSATWCGTGPR